MITPGDRPIFTGGIHNPADQLNDLASRVGMLEGIRYAAPLEYQQTPAGSLVSLRDDSAATGWGIIFFTLTSALDTTTPTATATVSWSFGPHQPPPVDPTQPPPDPNHPTWPQVTVNNSPDASPYFFTGAVGKRGIAIYDPTPAAQPTTPPTTPPPPTTPTWWILQMDCP